MKRRGQGSPLQLLLDLDFRAPRMCRSVAGALPRPAKELRCTRCNTMLLRQYQEWLCLNCGTTGTVFRAGHDASTDLVRKPRPWSEEDIAFVWANEPVNCEWVGRQMDPPRERSSVRAVCIRLGIRIKDRSHEVGPDGRIRQSYKYRSLWVHTEQGVEWNVSRATPQSPRRKP